MISSELVEEKKEEALSFTCLGQHAFLWLLCGVLGLSHG